MHLTTVAIDLAKNVFEVAGADERGHVIERRRLTRLQLERFLATRDIERVVMEACGTAHYWGRWLAARGVAVSLLPAHYVNAYVRRGKNDRADATALLEASRATDILPVPVKSVEQQGLQGLHRVRDAWRSTRVRRINTLRGLCREFGVNAPLGAKRGLATLGARLAEDDGTVPTMLRVMLQQLIDEIRSLEARIATIEVELARLAEQSPVCQRLQTIPGVGLISATAFVGAVADIGTFRTGRRFASWLGLTPKEHSSGQTRRLGAISKQGDVYLRTLLIHGARSLLLAAERTRRAGRPVDSLRAWGVDLRARRGHNKAAVSLANKMARIVWATWRHERDFVPRFVAA
jgi:transposase